MSSPTQTEMSSHSTAVGLLLVRTCGDKICSPYQYCSDLICHPCQDVCNNTSHNYEHNVCETRCQDYIHDKIKQYLTEADSLKATKDLQETIELLRKLVAASLTISALVALIVVAVLGFLWLRYRGRRHSSKRPNEMDIIDKKINTVSGLVNNNTSKEKSLRIDMPPLPPSGNSSTAAPSVITATTPISTRHPSEDATLEYAAYDNQGMTPSPILQTSTIGIGGEGVIGAGNGGCVGMGMGRGCVIGGETTF